MRAPAYRLARAAVRLPQWTEGLISAARAVGWGAQVLVDAADNTCNGKGKFEELIVASQEISASTAQLVAASRVKAIRGSKKQAKLMVARCGERLPRVDEKTGRAHADLPGAPVCAREQQGRQHGHAEPRRGGQERGRQGACGKGTVAAAGAPRLTISAPRCCRVQLHAAGKLAEKESFDNITLFQACSGEHARRSADPALTRASLCRPSGLR